MSNHTLFYKKPAQYWMETLPLGNGSLGAMSDSGESTERIVLNHDTLWTGRPRTVENKHAPAAFRKARALALPRKYRAAQRELEKRFVSVWSQAYLTFGTLTLTFDFTEVSGYERRLTLNDALLSSTFLARGKRVRKTAFASYPDSVLVYRVSAEAPFSCAAAVDCPLKNRTYASGNMLLTDGVCPSDGDTASPDYPCASLIYDEKGGVPFRGALKAVTDGELRFTEDTLSVSGATELTLYFTICTGFNGFDKDPATEGKEYKNAALQTVSDAEKKGYDALLRDHIADHAALYGRVKLELGGESDLPTDERLQRFETDGSDLSLYALLFNYGRYLAIAASRPGSRAMNLQGIWNNTVRAPWNANYTININTQMNYWPVLPCAMPELTEPLTELVKAVSVTGEATAKNFYGASGFAAHHNADVWGHSEPVQGSASWAYFPGGGGWLARHLYDYYAYTLDTAFLRDTAFPILRKAARFYLDILTQDADGTLMLCPGASPENKFRRGGVPCAVAKSAAMLNSIVLDVFRCCLKAGEILGTEDDLQAEIRAAEQRIKPLVIGKNGTVLEWNEELPETEIHHRHLSHLYGFFPSDLVDVRRVPELKEACRQSLLRRGDDGTGWSLAWKVNLWARLLDGDHALRLIDRQLRYTPAGGAEANYRNGGGTYPNMLDAHPPFQIDGNFGVTSGICEMLLQSDGTHIYLLPALPQKWANGSVKGLAAKGNVTVDMAWEKGKLVSYELHGNTKKMQIVDCTRQNSELGIRN